MLIKTGNGYIPTSSLKEILGALDDQLTSDQLDEMITEIDTDGSGTVDFDGTYMLLQNKYLLTICGRFIFLLLLFYFKHILSNLN